MRLVEVGLVALLAWANDCSGSPLSPQKTLQKRGNNCTSPAIRKEWRSLTADEKTAYIDAVHCMENKPSKTNFTDARNRFDDFHAVHHHQTPHIHFVGHFVLWHRMMVAEYERALRNECGYKGGQPYWDWSLDANPDDYTDTSIFETDIFSPTLGFGGNGPWVEVDPANDPFDFTGFGRTGGGCVQDGPFVPENFMVNVNQTEPKCLTRDFVPYVMNWFADPANVEAVLAQPDYTTFARKLEGVPNFSQPNIHGSGHFGTGGALGTMGNQYNSPGDPLFYLHHGNIDHVLWKWQQLDLDTRLHQVGGPVAPLDFGGANVTLDFEIDMDDVAGPFKLHQLLDTEGEVFCYTYEQ